LNISGVRKITILSHGKCIFPQTLSFRYAVSRIYVILRVAPPPEGSGPDSEGLKTRSFTSFRTTEQGPSRCSGRQSTRARYRDYVILRSGFATKNLTLVLNPGHSFVQDDRARSFALLRTTGTRFPPDGKDPAFAFFSPHPQLMIYTSDFGNKLEHLK